MRRMALAAIVALALSSSVQAAGVDEAYPAPGDGLLGGLVQERDVGLVFDYLREALGAAIEGREPTPPEKLMQRAEAIGDEVKRLGVAMARAILDSVERSVREGVKEPSMPPPSSPLQRIRY